MKSFYKNQNLNLIASTAQQIVFNNSKNGKVESTNTQDAIDEISNILDEEKTMISDAWNNETVYTEGQYCIYNNALWKCLVANTNTEPAEGTYWTQTRIDAEISAVNSNLNTLKNKTSIETHLFNTSSDVTGDSYTVQHTGWAMLYYRFNQSEYSQFGIYINGANAAGNNISSGNSNFGGTGVIPLYLQEGDVVEIAYFSTFRMSAIELRVRY